MDTFSNPAMVNPQYNSTQQTQPQMMQQGQAPMQQYSHGGGVHPAPHFIPAHFNRDELHALDMAQGSRTHIPGTHTRIYKRLDNMMKHPHALAILKEHIEHGHAEHHAHGEDVREIAHHHNNNGRYGDTEKAYITPHLKQILDHARGGESRNPHDGDPEYFGLNIGNLLSGLKSAASTAAGHVGNFVNKIPEYANNAYNKAQGVYNTVNENPFGHALIEGGKAAIGAKLGGGNMGDALRSGLNTGVHAGFQGQQGPIADAARGAANTIGSGGSLRDAAFGGAHEAASHLPGPAGNIAQGAIRGGYNSGLRGALTGGANTAASHLPDYMQGPARGAINYASQRFATGGPIGARNAHAYMPSALMMQPHEESMPY